MEMPGERLMMERRRILIGNKASDRPSCEVPRYELCLSRGALPKDVVHWLVFGTRLPQSSVMFPYYVDEDGQWKGCRQAFCSMG